MPYIKQERRAKYDEHIKAIIHEVLVNVDYHDDVDGEMNYVITRIVAGAFSPTRIWRYRFAARAYGCFLAAAAEFYRRILAPFEQGAIERNGDIREYNREPDRTERDE